MLLQLPMLMWLRTTMNYQYRYAAAPFVPLAGVVQSTPPAPPPTRARTPYTLFAPLTPSPRRHGTSTWEALRALHGMGGVPRFYCGLGPALIQGPLSRFG